MAKLRWPGLPTVIAISFAALAVIGLGALFVAWLGIYNVAASKGHLAVTRWFLEIGMSNSVAYHADSNLEPPPLEDPALVSLGAGVYGGQCAVCHGGPGSERNPITLQMLPPPPRLSGKISDWTAQELFWLVKHGLKYTAMPGWTAPERDEEIWSVVAFLRKLPELAPDRYRALTKGSARQSGRPANQLVNYGAGTADVAVCARCHGDAEAGPVSPLVPRLHRQRPEYLRRALKEYAYGVRPSGIMQPVAAELTEREITQLAEYYAGLPPRLGGNSGDQPAEELLEPGSRIAAQGVPERDVPACMKCHSGAGLPTYPSLIGQHPRYIVQQLQLWQRGSRRVTPESRIMAPIAERMSPEQIEAVAAYFGSLAVETTTTSQTNDTN